MKVDRTFEVLKASIWRHFELLYSNLAKRQRHSVLKLILCSHTQLKRTSHQFNLTVIFHYHKHPVSREHHENTKLKQNVTIRELLCNKLEIFWSQKFDKFTFLDHAR